MLFDGEFIQHESPALSVSYKLLRTRKSSWRSAIGLEVGKSSGSCPSADTYDKNHGKRVQPTRFICG